MSQKMRRHLVVPTGVERLPTLPISFAVCVSLAGTGPPCPPPRTFPCWPSPRIAFRLSSEAGAHARPGARRRKVGSTPSREVTHHLSVPTRLCSDSGDDEIEHAVGPIRVRRMFVHQGDSVDESYHVENMDIRSDLFCGLGAE